MLPCSKPFKASLLSENVSPHKALVVWPVCLSGNISLITSRFPDRASSSPPFSASRTVHVSRLGGWEGPPTLGLSHLSVDSASSKAKFNVSAYGWKPPLSPSGTCIPRCSPEWACPCPLNTGRPLGTQLCGSRDFSFTC